MDMCSHFAKEHFSFTGVTPCMTRLGLEKKIEIC